MSDLINALIAAKLMGNGGGGGGGVAFGFDTFVSKWTQDPDWENVYDITIYAFSGNALNEIGTGSVSREIDSETGDPNMVVGSITFTDSDYGVYETLLYQGIDYFTINHFDFFAELIDGEFPTFGFFISV